MRTPGSERETCPLFADFAEGLCFRSNLAKNGSRIAGASHGPAPDRWRSAFIEPGAPWKNGYIESFNARLRDELLDGEIIYTLKEAQVLVEDWRRHNNAVRPHSSLQYRPPATEVLVPQSWPTGSAEKPSMH